MNYDEAIAYDILRKFKQQARIQKVQHYLRLRKMRSFKSRQLDREQDIKEFDISGAKIAIRLLDHAMQECT